MLNFWNTVKTWLLMIVLSVLIVVFGKMVGGIYGATYALIFAGLLNFISYIWSDKIVLAMYRAKYVSPEEAPQLYAILEKLANNAGIPTPRLYIIESPHANAFATGRSPKHAAVAVTTGLLSLLSQDELEGVLAHELSHIKHRDILVMTVAATLASAITYLSYMARWIFVFGGADDDDFNPLAILLFTILAPLAATLIQLAISRSREYMADESGAVVSGKPLALASALEKISAAAYRRPFTEATPTTAHLFIANPFGGRKTSILMSLFSTHPPVEKRIARLHEIAKTMGLA